MTNYTNQHIQETIEILQKVDQESIERVAQLMANLRKSKGRLFFLGVGGSAANCSHAVNDFRKIGGFEAYTPVDNVSELTARTNDEGWDTVFEQWLISSRISANDMVFVLSVGGGNIEKNISPNIVFALKHALNVKAKIVGIVGRDGGYTAAVADACVIIPVINENNITPHSEAMQGVVWHLLVSHPLIKIKDTKWESSVDV